MAVFPPGPCRLEVRSPASSQQPSTTTPSARTVQELRAELAALLAEPLQPNFSKKFFTGGAAAAVAAHLPGAAAAAGGGGGKGAKGGKQQQQQQRVKGAAAGERDKEGGASSGEEEEAPAEPAGHAPAGATVQEVVQLAASLAASRARAAAEVKQKAAKVREGPMNQLLSQRRACCVWFVRFERCLWLR